MNRHVAGFVAYLHSKPDGSVFYVGKGNRYRATDFSPTRRTLHHKNVTNKYGRENIIVSIFPCDSEREAFQMERDLIEKHRTAGAPLVNLTDGGEGTSGRKFTSEQLAQHIEASKRGWDKRGRNPRQPKEETQPLVVACKHCAGIFTTLSPRKMFCSDTCQQRYSRSLVPKQKTADYKSNTTGRKGVYLAPSGKWTAGIGINGRLVHLGTFELKSEAIQAREIAERQYGRS